MFTSSVPIIQRNQKQFSYDSEDFTALCSFLVLRYLISRFRGKSTGKTALLRITKGHLNDRHLVTLRGPEERNKDWAGSRKANREKDNK